MQTLKESLKCAFLAALIALACYGIRLEIRAESAIGRVVLIADRTEADANRRVSDLITRADTQLDGIRGLAEKRTGEALRIVRQEAASVDVQLSGARSDLNSQLTALNSTAGLALGRIDEHLAPLDQILTDAAQVSHDHMVEKGSHASWPAEISGSLRAFELAMGSTEKTMKVVAEEAPKIGDATAGTAQSINVTGQEVAIAARRFNAPQTKLQAFRAWLLAIARIVGAL